MEDEKWMKVVETALFIIVVLASINIVAILDQFLTALKNHV